ncbi:phosphoenolpyruvate--protein phosphotransferase [Ornithinimicrobium sp. Y1694]|uniref:phosphoenolpyruvate--protein phosphotransferase n=1 Tax=Ornithinimicrobium sp. Y1694 TaxID=3418590 RepID=UPI003CEA2CDC
MIALVVVSHSHALAQAAVALASEMAPPDGAPAIEIAAGLDETTLGTDAAAVSEAITRAAEAAGGDGVLVLLDLGSAVLSAEMALEFVDPQVAEQVRLSPAPLVEGLVQAVVSAAAGADLDTAAREARAGLAAKAAQLGEEDAGEGSGRGGPGGDLSAGGADAGSGEDHEPPTGPSVELSVVGEHGLHARPAARVVGCVAPYGPETVVSVRNLSTGGPAVDALSLSGLATLGALQGHVLEATASGPRAQEVLNDLVELAAQAFGDHPAPAEPLADVEATSPATSTEPGIAGSGLEAAIGPVVRVDVDLDPDDRPAKDPETEQRTVRDAVDEAVERLGELAEQARRHLGTGQAEVFDAHALLLRDPELTRRVDDGIEAGASAARAWADAISATAAGFEELDDAYQRERAQDVRSIGERVLRILLGVEEPEAIGEGVLVVDELDPAMAIALDATAVRGVLTTRGGATGHGVLIATARGMPVLTGRSELAEVAAGTVVGMDARSGRVEIDPSPEVVAHFEELLRVRREERERAMAGAGEPVRTTDGTEVQVEANVSSLATARLGASMGADGSGLVRTEAVFGQWRQAPTVAEHQEVYAAIADAMAPHPVTIRTWDVGGDKPLPFIRTVTEENPFLGARGLRAFATEPDALLDQLEAICRVAVDHRVQVLFPMVTTREDVRLAMDLLRRAAERAGLEGIPPELAVGIMIEVPAAALRARVLTEGTGLDFVSIGSNDLSQYVLAAERGNPELAAWSDNLEPAVLRMIQEVADSVAEGIDVAVCGAMAGDPEIAGLLVGLGVRQLSVSPAAVPIVKERLRTGSLADYENLADRALACADAAEVRALLQSSV